LISKTIDFGLVQSERKTRLGFGSLVQTYASGEGNSSGGLESRIDMVAAVTRQGDACSKTVLLKMWLVEQMKDSTVLP